MSKHRLVLLAAAGAVGLGIVAVPAVAGAGPFGAAPAATSGPGPGWDDGGGNGMGMTGQGMTGQGRSGAGMGVGRGDGSCLDALPAKGTLTTQQQSTVAAMAQEEKLAHDLYVAFAARYDAVIFDRIAASEVRHLTMVRVLLERYGLADPTAGTLAGRFSDPIVQATYDRLLAQGQADLSAALRVGQTVEQTDIHDVEAALNGLTAADVTQVYRNLQRASRHHLTAFQRWS